MILFFVLVLTASVSEQANLDNLRRSRPLDLGLQDISKSNEKTPKTARETETLDPIQNGYLPPLSVQLSPKVIAAQSQQNYDFKSINSVKTELCKPPFDVIFCGLNKEFSKSVSEIIKPSTNLVPPFNDVGENIKPPTTTLKGSEIIKSSHDNLSGFSALSHTTFATTTRKPLIKVSEKNKNVKKPPTPSEASSTAEATNELRSYLPPQPEYSEAAQTNVGVVQAPNQNHQDHHHGHHDHHHGDICSDAFHSFLCAPLKARKRITGALPQNLKGQSSFVQFQRVLPSPDKDTAPSNTFANEHLPPKPTAFSTNLISSVYAPSSTSPKQVTTATTTTTPRPYSSPKLILQPSNVNDRFYLPPLTNNQVLSVSSQPSNQISTKLHVSSTTEKPLTLATQMIPIRPEDVSPIIASTEQPVTRLPIVSASPTVLSDVPSVSSFQKDFSYPSSLKPVISFVSLQLSNENRFHLSPNSQSSTSKKELPTSTITPRLSTFSKFVSQGSNSIFSTPQPKLSPFVPTTIRPSPVRISQAPVIVTTRKPPVQSFAPQASNPDLSYLPPQPKIQSASNFVTTTVKPITTTSRRPLTTTTKFVPKHSNIDLSYLPVDPSVQPAAAQINSEAVAAPASQIKNPFHHGRDLCTDPFHNFLCVAPKPRRRLTGALPSGFKPDSSNTNVLTVKPASSFQKENRVKPGKPLETSQSQNLGYSYSKPINSFPLPSSTISSSTQAPTTGYSYPKPEKTFPLPYQQQEVVRITTTEKPIPIYRTSEARVVSGYEYPKPVKNFSLPSKQQIIKVATKENPSTGYSYQKPQNPFPLPTEQKEISFSTSKPSSSSFVPLASLSTNQVKGYQYPKPQQSFNLPDKKGYSYPKPEKRLELPTESQSESLLPQKNPTLNFLQNLGSAEFIPVNKLDKREDSTKSLGGVRRFGERLRKREKRPSK